MVRTFCPSAKTTHPTSSKDVGNRFGGHPPQTPSTPIYHPTCAGVQHRTTMGGRLGGSATLGPRQQGLPVPPHRDRRLLPVGLGGTIEKQDGASRDRCLRQNGRRDRILQLYVRRHDETEKRSSFFNRPRYQSKYRGTIQSYLEKKVVSLFRLRTPWVT